METEDQAQPETKGQAQPENKGGAVGSAIRGGGLPRASPRRSHFLPCPLEPSTTKKTKKTPEQITKMSPTSLQSVPNWRRVSEWVLEVIFHRTHETKETTTTTCVYVITILEQHRHPSKIRQLGRLWAPKLRPKCVRKTSRKRHHKVSQR